MQGSDDQAVPARGLSIEEIRQALAFLPPRRAPTSDYWERLASHLRDAAGQRITGLHAILSELTPVGPGDSDEIKLPNGQDSLRSGTAA